MIILIISITYFTAALKSQLKIKLFERTNNILNRTNLDLLGQISLLFGQIIISYLIGQITICSDELGFVRTYTVLGFIRTNSKSLFIRINNFV